MSLQGNFSEAFVTSLQINFCKNRNTNIKLLLYFFINILQNSLQTLLSIRKKIYRI